MKTIRDRLYSCCLICACCIIGGGCGSQQPLPPPALPALSSPLPGPPPEPKPLEVDQEELRFVTEQGEPLDKVALATNFRAIFRFHLIEPPVGGLQKVGVQLIAYVNGKPTIAWESFGVPVAEENGFYRYEAELRSPPKAGRKFFVRADVGDKRILVEKEIAIGSP
jgi:hypothetical protein